MGKLPTSTLVTDLEITARCRNVLLWFGKENYGRKMTIADMLSEVSAFDLMREPDFGRKSLQVVIDAMAEAGYTWPLKPSQRVWWEPPSQRVWWELTSRPMVAGDIGVA